MALARRLARVLVPFAVGGIVAALSLVGTARTTPLAARGQCYSGLRLLRHAIASYEAQHGHLPDLDVPRGSGPGPGSTGPAELLVLELTQPRDPAGRPHLQGPLPGLINAIPANPFTGSSLVVVVPEGADPVAFAAASRAGWAYLPLPDRDAVGPLPAGLMLPCGGDTKAGTGTPVQDLAFEIEDFERWR
jgi:hypothetical protein